MSRLYWDTMLFVYWLEANPRYADRIANIRSRMKERGDELCTSAFTVGELLVAPYKRNALEAVQQAQDLFRPPFVTVIPFNRDAAFQYARIRSRLAVSAPDAIHLACAATAQVDLFLTNDEGLIGKHVPGIQFIAGLKTDLL